MGFFDLFKKKEEPAVPAGPIVVAADAKGAIVKMEDIPDEVFAQGILGQCCGIDPAVGEVYAPIDGEITQAPDSLHALGIQGVGGVEVLIHVGVDTVEMKGDGFSSNVKLGDKIKKGQLLLTMDLDKIKAAGILSYLKGFLDPVFILAPINVLSECFTPVSMACRHFGNILSGTVISTLIYAALTTANNALFGFLGSSLYAGIALVILGGILIGLGLSRKKKRMWIPGAIVAVLGVLAVLTNLGADYPWLTIGIPAIPSLYFDWFGGCIQAFIFCTLTTLFIKQAAGD